MSELTDAIALLARRGYTIIAPLCGTCENRRRIATVIRTEMPGRMHLTLDSVPCPTCRG